jgi:serine/threonine protein kinase
MAPELLKQKNNNLLIANDKIDIYSLGIVIYKLITAYHPKDLGPILSFRRADWENFSQHAQDFVEKCLDKNVDSRMDAKQALLHPWLSQ